MGGTKFVAMSLVSSMALSSSLEGGLSDARRYSMQPHSVIDSTLTIGGEVTPANPAADFDLATVSKISRMCDSSPVDTPFSNPLLYA
jgi:hypothetical protein